MQKKQRVACHGYLMTQHANLLAEVAPFAFPYCGKSKEPSTNEAARLALASSIFGVLEKAERSPRRSETFALEGSEGRSLSIYAMAGKWRRMKNSPEQALEIYHRPTTRESRTTKGTVKEQLLRLLLYILRRGAGSWTPMKYEQLRASLGVGKTAFQEAKNALDADPSCPVVFETGNRSKVEHGQDFRGKFVLMALRCWLDHDRRPLLFRRDGKSRGLRPNSSALASQVSSREERPTPNSASNNLPSLKGQQLINQAAASSSKNLKDSRPGKSPAKNYKPLRGKSGVARKLVSPKLAAWAWSLADSLIERAHSTQGICRRSLQSIILDALHAGVWRTHIFRSWEKAFLCLHSSRSDGYQPKSVAAVLVADFQQRLGRCPTLTVAELSRRLGSTPQLPDDSSPGPSQGAPSAGSSLVAMRRVVRSERQMAHFRSILQKTLLPLSLACWRADRSLPQDVPLLRRRLIELRKSHRVSQEEFSDQEAFQLISPLP